MPQRGLFGKPMGMGGQMPPIAPQQPAMGDPAPGLGMRSDQPEEQQRKPGIGTRLFGQGWEDKAYALGGVLRGDSSGVQMMRQEQAQQQQAAAQAAAEQRKRAEALADYGARKEIDQRYVTPDRTAMQQNYEYLQQIDPAAAKAFLQRQTEPIQWITGPDDIPRPYGGGGQVGGAPPQAPVGKLTPLQGDGASNGAGGFLG